MNRARAGHLVLVSVALALALTAPSAASRQAAGSRGAPRNVVFILSDDHRYDFMGFMDGAPPFLETPSLDRMAKQGVHFRNAFVTTALCSPSRASILTGQYAHRHGIVDNSSPIPRGTKFFPQSLQQAGYRTAFIGKWHMGDIDDLPQPGFDHWVSFRGQGVWDVQELYDLHADPRERANLADVPEHQERVRQLRQRLWDRLEASGGMSVPLRRGDWQAAQRKGGR